MKDIELIYKLNKDWRPGTIKVKKAGGQTNRNYIVQHKNKKFFVRLPWETNVIDRKIEGKNILALNRNRKLKDILPKYYVYILAGRNILSGSKTKFDFPDGAMVTEYIPGRIFTLSLFKNRKYQEKLAQMFYALHHSGIHFASKYDVFRDELGRYRLATQEFPIQKILDPQIISNLYQIEKKAKLMVSKSRLVPTHNDFLFQNFLLGDNDRLYLLDFEYAGMNERGGILYELGYFFADNLFRKPAITKELFEEFLRVAEKVYKRRFDRKQIYWLALAVPVMQIWWGLLRYFSVKTTKEKKYFKNYILRRTEGIEFLFRDIDKTSKK